MQVARLLDPHERTLPGKLRQLWRTAQLEWHLSKDQILNLYLNRAPFGGTLQGVAAASWAYLGKSPQQLTHAEAALLAVLPQAPSRCARTVTRSAPRWPGTKCCGAWPSTRCGRNRRSTKPWKSRCCWRRAWNPAWRRLLARRLNRPDSPPLIRTTLGREPATPSRRPAAGLACAAAGAHLGGDPGGRNRKHGRARLPGLGGHQRCAALWPCGYDQRLRSPGSTLKPFLYGMAMDAGLIHSESLLQDVPRRYGDYRPGNFSMGFSGAVSASTALASR
jgi:penicillin-binding protein 1C